MGKAAYPKGKICIFCWDQKFNQFRLDPNQFVYIWDQFFKTFYNSRKNLKAKNLFQKTKKN